MVHPSGLRALLAERSDQLRAFFGVPAAEQRSEHFTAVGALKQGHRHLLVSGADDAPTGAPGDR